ncbi:Morn repeat protein [Pandoravirus inopinatum]|uniref:Morn repeat protein n=1 Tax=Pandoravirus inopinatum TaxID=1605721 RepID=A0A0B5JA16_9VIRU|nr:Morn repeat protein [Pandoravirus inopinatum]AJF97711.1 Morn repeat protein [Pandoravirus inopinatum]
MKRSRQRQTPLYLVSPDHGHGSDKKKKEDEDANNDRRKRRAVERTPEEGGPVDTESVLDLLPGELVTRVFLVTGNVANIANLSRTSWRYYRLANDRVLWKRMYELRFGPPRHTIFTQRGKDWRWLYRARACDGRVAGTPTGQIPYTIEGMPALYWGDLANGVPQGYGLLVASNATTGGAVSRYEGDFSHGKYDGHGVCVWASGSKYEGGYIDGKKHGCGTYTWPNGDCYQGGYADDKKHGYGVHQWPDGQRHEGGYADGKKHGYGVYQWPDGRRYEGGYVDDKRHGQGVYTWPDGKQYKGSLVNGRKHGPGVYTHYTGERYEGAYVDDQRHGHGLSHYLDGSRASGSWVHGACVGGMVVLAHADPSNPARQCGACAALIQHIDTRRLTGNGPTDDRLRAIRLLVGIRPAGPCPFSPFVP